MFECVCLNNFHLGNLNISGHFHNVRLKVNCNFNRRLVKNIFHNVRLIVNRCHLTKKLLLNLTDQNSSVNVLTATTDDIKIKKMDRRFNQHLYLCNIYNFKNGKARQRNVYKRRNHFSLPEEEFRKRYRLPKSAVQCVINLVHNDIKSATTRNRALSSSQMVLLTLRFYATGSFLIVIGDHNGVSIATASRVIKKLSTAIARLSSKYIQMPESQEDMRKTAEKFYNIAVFPKVIGAIDCTHVKIQSPGRADAEIFRCRKGYFSLNVQAICNSKLEITDIVARWPGSAHDSYIFNNSRIKARFESGEFGSYMLLGDGGYGVKSYLMTPLGNPQSRAEKLYNESQIRTRNTIERCFGVLKRRFPVLSLGMRVSLETTMAIIVSCAILHNLCRLLKDDGDFGDCIVSSDEEEEVTVDRFSKTRSNLIDNYFGKL